VDGALADAVVVLHFAFLAFVVGGGLLAWRWPWLIWPHLAAAAWGAAIVVFSVNCPLTHLENMLRARAGEPELSGGFIDTYIEGVLYPQRYINEARALAAVVVLMSWLVFLQRWRRRSDRAADAEQPLVQHHGHR
jgi:hypothetical protein